MKLAMLRRDFPEEVKSGIRTVIEAGKASTAKYSAASNMLGSDSRLRGSLQFFGAHNGRWSGRGFQIHNLPREQPKNDYEFLRRKVIFNGDLPDDPLNTLSTMLRGLIIPPPGKKLYVADFSQIECRLLFLLAKCKIGLKTFLQGGDVYCDLASVIYDRVITKTDEEERFMGKTRCSWTRVCYEPHRILARTVPSKRSALTIRKRSLKFVVVSVPNPLTGI